MLYDLQSARLPTHELNTTTPSSLACPSLSIPNSRFKNPASSFA